MKGMKHIQSALIAITASTPAIAEVCDKVRPAWNPEDGPVSQIDDLVLFFSEPVGLGTWVLVGVCIFLRRTWFTLLVITVMITIVALLTKTWFEEDYISAFAVSEGCLTAPVLTGITLVAISIFLALVQWGASQRSKNPIP